MFDNAMGISDEMLAAYIDGNSTPLEKIIVGTSISDEDVVEVLELSEDCKNLNDLEIEPIDISDLIDDFTKPFKDYNELKTNLDSPDNSTVM